jgi:gluconokinase
VDVVQQIVVMGVSGCGKSTVGQGLASRLGLRFVEGDVLHPPRNVALMASGTPLTDEDRQGWLQSVAAELATAPSPGVVITCSALKRSYRNLLRQQAPRLRLVYLTGPAALLSERMQSRPGHYMPPSLLPSQLQTLEPPGPEENAIVLSITQPLAQQLDEACGQLASR